MEIKGNFLIKYFAASSDIADEPILPIL